MVHVSRSSCDTVQRRPTYLTEMPPALSRHPRRLRPRRPWPPAQRRQPPQPPPPPRPEGRQVEQAEQLLVAVAANVAAGEPAAGEHAAAPGRRRAAEQAEGQTKRDVSQVQEVRETNETLLQLSKVVVVTDAA